MAGGDGSVERAVDVRPNEMEVDESGHRASGGPAAGEPARPREILMVVRRQLRRECHQCLRSRHRQNRMSTTLRAMQPIVRGVSIVLKVEDVHLHTRLFPKESCLKLESTALTLGHKDSK